MTLKVEDVFGNLKDEEITLHCSKLPRTFIHGNAPLVAFKAGYELAKVHISNSFKYRSLHVIDEEDFKDLERLRKAEEYRKECDKRDCSECVSYWASSTSVACNHPEQPQNDYAFDWNMACRCHWYKKKPLDA